MIAGERRSLIGEPDTINQLPDDQRAQVAGAFADAITNVFLWAVPLVLLGWTLTWLLKEKPLRTSSGQARRAQASANGSGHLPAPAEPDGAHAHGSLQTAVVDCART